MRKTFWHGKKTKYFENNLSNAFHSLNSLIKGVIYYCQSVQSFNLATNMAIGRISNNVMQSNNHLSSQDGILYTRVSYSLILAVLNALRGFGGAGGGAFTNNNYLSMLSLSKIFTYIEKIAYSNRRGSIIGSIIFLHLSYATLLHFWDSSEQLIDNYLLNDVSSTNNTEKNLMYNAASQGFNWSVILLPIVNLTVYYGTSLLDRVIKKYCNELPLIKISDVLKKDIILINPSWKGKSSKLKNNGNIPKKISDFNSKEQERINQYIDSGDFTPFQSDDGTLDHEFSAQSLVTRLGLGLGCFSLSMIASALLDILKSNPSNYLILYVTKHLLGAVRDLNGSYVVLMQLTKPLFEKLYKKHVTDMYITPNKKISGAAHHLRAAIITCISLSLSYLFYGSTRLIVDKVPFCGVPVINDSILNDCISQLLLGMAILFENTTVFYSLLPIMERSHVFTCDEIEFANDNRLEEKMNSLRRRGNISIAICFILTTLESAQLIALSYMNPKQRGSLLNYHMNALRMLISGTTNVFCLFAGTRLLVNSQLIENELNKRGIVRGNNEHELTKVSSYSNVSTATNLPGDNIKNPEAENLLSINNRIDVSNANQISVSLPNLGELSVGDESYISFIKSIRTVEMR
jgi:hypothetical protein